MPVARRIGLVLIPIFLIFLFLNGMVMLLSPSLWFRLPRYLALRGAVEQPRYKSTPFGRFQIRVLGLVFAIFTAWALLSFFGLGPNGAGAPIRW